jgi:hypothetical protein
MGYDDGMSDETRPGSFWDGRSLGEEPMVSLSFHFLVNKLIWQSMRPTTVVLAYRRAILIAVYTHLLRTSPACQSTWPAADETVLDAGSQTWWRWVNITIFLATWSLELLLEADDDIDNATRWKMD